MKQDRSASPYEGLSSLFTPPASENSHDDDYTMKDKRRDSIVVGNEINMLIETDHAKNAIDLLKEAMAHLESDKEDPERISIVYSRILKSLCDPTISSLINEGPDIYSSILWRLFTRKETHIAVVNTLMDEGHVSLALQVMYTLIRQDWDTDCYRIALLLHLMQRPRQIREAEGLLLDYGKPYLEMIDNNKVIKVDMPLMSQVTDSDKEQLWMLYQVGSSTDKEWDRRQSLYEAQKKEYTDRLRERKRRMSWTFQDWAVEQLLHKESEREFVDQSLIQLDNSMIYSGARHQQYEYAWKVYLAMQTSLDEVTPCLVMHLCWMAFEQTPEDKVTQRREWETRAWSVYSRFMCSEYLHPEAPETPGFLHDLLMITTHSPEREARLTKVMSVYHLLDRLSLGSLLSDERVLEPILCSILYECSQVPINEMCRIAFNIWHKKWEFDPSTQQSVIWGLALLCLTCGDKEKFKQLLEKIKQPLSSIMAPVQAFHDDYLCNDKDCYFNDYMFQRIKYTDRTVISTVDQYGLDQHRLTNINEPEAMHIVTAALEGLTKKDSIQREMYYSEKKANVILRHCLLT
ncbi:hypothetical protein CU098_010618, partial [Rhizopus stolonifer]